MTGWIATLVAAGAVLLGAAAGANAQSYGDAEKGRAFAQRACAECHAVLKGQQQSPHPVAPSFTRIAQTPTISGIALEVLLTTPHETMPNLVLSADERANVIAYIQTLK